MKKVIFVLFCFALILGVQVQVSAEDVQVVKVLASQPEYLMQERQIWDIFEEENPGIKIEVMTINEGEQQNAFNAKVAAGNPPVDISTTKVTKNNYNRYVNLLIIDFPWWDNYEYDVRSTFEEVEGVPNYVAAANPWFSTFFSFIYYKDEMEKAGLNPKKTVRSIEGLFSFLEKLKQYVDQNDEIDYVLDLGWHSWCIMTMNVSDWPVAFTGSKEGMQKVYRGEIKWTDLENNPFVDFFKLHKRLYDNGYTPRKWWTRDWESEFESGFIARKSILAFHGPWLWDKVLAADPTAQLDGFPFPSKTGQIGAAPVLGHTSGGNVFVMFKQSKEQGNYEAVKKAYIWWHSPETIKYRAEALGKVPYYDLSSVGGADLQSPQYKNVIEPVFNGEFGDVEFNTDLRGFDVVAQYKKDGAAYPLADDAVAGLIGDYLEERIDMKELMGIIQKRWENAYPELAKKQN